MFKPSIYKYTDILRLSSSGEYFTDTNPYWEYSPTGSTILNARLSRTALEPKYFYSNAISASLGPEFSNSASFHFARVQDDRLTGNLNNLFPISVIGPIIHGARTGNLGASGVRGAAFITSRISLLLASTVP